MFSCEFCKISKNIFLSNTFGGCFWSLCKYFYNIKVSGKSNLKWTYNIFFTILFFWTKIWYWYWNAPSFTIIIIITICIHICRSIKFTSFTWCNWYDHHWKFIFSLSYQINYSTMISTFTVCTITRLLNEI